jgi:lysophospholipase L1-like esterase
VGQRRFILFTGILAAVLAAAGPAAASTAKADSPAAVPQHGGGWSAPHYDYYLALGDSLGAGWQPNPVTGVGSITNQGYAADIAAQLKHGNRNLHYVNLACPGETTTSMLDGGCPYPEAYSNQEAAAESFLHAHRGARILVTLDIGANNIDGCLTSTGISTSCITSGLEAAGTDLPEIVGGLETAGGRNTSIYAMNYYDPFLAEWLTGSAGQTLATESVALSAEFNGVLSTVYQAYHVPVANVSGQFDSADFTPLVPLSATVTVPLNVARICEWTWMCAPAPVGPNIHANATGYRQIADAFDQVIFPRRRH